MTEPMTEDEIREWLKPRVDEYLSNFGSTLVGRAFDVIDPESKADAVEFFTNLFARVVVDPANLDRIR